MTTPRSSDQLAPGQRLGPFLLLAPLGSGGSARVWAVARMGQLGFTKRMVLKVMRQDKLGSERARQRFDREASLGARLRHFNLRAVHELGSHEGRPYMAMAWVDTSLAELLENAPERRLEPSTVCWLGIQTCAALATAHSHVNDSSEPSPIVHGDVSPGNILVTKNGHVQLADLAADADPSPRGSTEDRGGKQFFGSLGYAAPEALKGAPLDGRADLFSLGAVLYEALTGCPAFDGDDERSVIFQILEQSPVDVRQRNPEIPEHLARVIRRAMERRTEERFQSADEMSAALVECVAGLSAFRLEEGATRVIEQVLGGRIRAREDEMRFAYQRFSVSQLERTDTLPISNSVRADVRPVPITADSLPSTWREARDLDHVPLTASRRPWTIGLAAVLIMILGGGLYVIAALKRPGPVAERGPRATPGGPVGATGLSNEVAAKSEAVAGEPSGPQSVGQTSVFADAGLVRKISQAPRSEKVPQRTGKVKKGTVAGDSMSPAHPTRQNHVNVQRESQSRAESKGFTLPPPDPYTELSDEKAEEQPAKQPRPGFESVIPVPAPRSKLP